MPTRQIATALSVALSLVLSMNLASGAVDRVRPDYDREAHHAAELRHGTLAGEPIEIVADWLRDLPH